MTLMGLNITDATCDYGLAQTAEGCARVLATYDPSVYLHFQIAYCVVGSATLIVSAVMYYRADKHDGSPLQLSTFLFCCYAALTMIVRGADPSSYGHIIPRPVGAFLSDSCTAALYSVYVIALGYWATIIQRGAAVIHKPAHLKCLECAAIAFIWGFYIAYDMSLFAFKGFIPPTLNHIQLGVSASMLALIALAFLIYGLRVMTRLQEYERQLKLRMPSFESDYSLSNHSFDLNVSDSEDEAPERRVAPRRPKAGHTAKIRRILLVAEAVSIVVIAGQVYMVTQVSYSPVELASANGMLCSTVRPKWSLLHVFQVVAVWAILYVFRDVEKKSVIPHPRGSRHFRALAK